MTFYPSKNEFSRADKTINSILFLKNRSYKNDNHLHSKLFISGEKWMQAIMLPLCHVNLTFASIDIFYISSAVNGFAISYSLP